MKSRLTLPLLVVLTIAAYGHGLQGSVPDVPTGQWMPGGPLAHPREGAVSVALDDGRVLVIGGRDAAGPVAAVEAFHADGSFTVVAPMSIARARHTAVRLADGSVLVAGGTTVVITDQGTAEAPTASAEIFLPASNTWIAGPPLAVARTGHTATALADGRVLVAGGTSELGPLDSIEVFEPLQAAFRAAGVLSAARSEAAAAVAGPTQVLVVGGRNADGVLSTADLVDVESGATSQVLLNSPRAGASATTLLDGTVLVAGGTDGTNDLGTAEVIDAITGLSSAVGSMSRPRTGHQAVLLDHNANVLIVGGSNADGVVTTAETFAPWTGQFATANPPTVARTGAIVASTATEGVAVLAGGETGTVGYIAASELYGFATVKTGKNDYPPGEFVTITGSGWQPGEIVNLVLHEIGTGEPDLPLIATADAQGNIFNDVFAPNEHDDGVRFYLTATGAGSTAQSTFTDGKSNSVTVVGQTPNPVQAGSSAAYTVNVGFNGNSNPCTTTLSATTVGSPAWPAPPPGGFFSFATNPVTGMSSASTPLTVSAPSGMLPGTYHFTVSTTDTGNCQSSGGATSAQINFVVTDTIAPTVTSIARAAATPTNAASVQWTVTFSEAVTGVDQTDFALAATGLTGSPAITGVTGGGASYTVTASTGAATGTLGLNLNDNDTIRDAATNRLGGIGTGVAGGGGAGNGSVVGQTYSIDRTLTPQITTADKSYDGTTAAAILTRTFTSALTVTEDVSVDGGTATFASKTVGTGKTVTATGLTLAGAAASKYILSSTSATATADIAARSLTVTAAGQNKIYDGTVAAAVTFGDDRVPGDVFTVSAASATFADKNVGTSKPISVSGIALLGTDAGNYALASTAAGASANITPRSLTVGVTAQNRVYDATTVATVSLSDDRISGDVLTTSYTSATFGDKHVGTGKTVSVTGVAISGVDAPNYFLTSTTATTTADISVATVTGTFTALSKTYDATTSAVVATRSLAGVIGSDVVGLAGGGATFDTKDVGLGKTVTAIGFTLSGADAGNYVLASATLTATADVTALAISGGFSANNKAYDATTTATIATRTLSGVLGADVVALTGGTGTFDTKAVGNGKTVTATGFTLAGGDAPNYVLSPTTLMTTADITPATVTGSFTAQNRVYDGTTDATILTRTLAGVLGADVVSLTGGTATFDSKNVGSGKTVTGTGFALSDADAGNYALQSITLTATADITPKILTGTITADDKVYDGTTAAVVHAQPLGGVLGSDVVTLQATNGQFDTRNAGSGKPVNADLALSGADAANYSVNPTATAAAAITPKPLTGTIVADDKVYDGTTVAVVHAQALPSVIGSDAVTLQASNGAFDTQNAGTGKTVTADLSLQGADAANYSVNATATTSADITPKPASVTPDPATKVYGDADPTFTGTLAGFLAADAVTVTYERSAGETVGDSPYTITATLSSAGALTNYAVTYNTADFTITAKTVAPHVAASDKTYDGTTAASITNCTVSPVVNADDVACAAGTAAFETPHAGTGKGVTANGITLTGASAGNYVLGAASTTTTATIHQLSVTPNVTAGDKTYDGGTTASIVACSVAPAVGGDDVGCAAGSASFDTAAAGTAKPVTATAITLTGTSAANYVLATGTAATTANVTPLGIAPSLTASDKVYDGTATAAILTRSLSGTVSGDVVSLVGGTASFADKNVGDDKVVTAIGMTLAGPDAGNYSLPATPPTTTADITARPLTVGASGSNKVYDSNATATVTLSDDRVSGDALTPVYATASFNNKHVGNGKPVNVTGITVGGADAANYSFNTAASTTASITPRSLTVSATAQSKVYDTTTAATVALSDNRVAGDVLTVNHGGAQFADKNVGTGKTVTVASISVTGSDASNYAFNATATTTANITPAQLTVTAVNQSILFGAPAAAFSVTYSGFVGSETPSALTGTLTFTFTGSSPAYGPSTAPPALVGTYAVKPGGYGVGNYQITYVDGMFTIGTWTFLGFFSPIDNSPVVNVANAGQAIPVKWRLTDGFGSTGNPDSFAGLISYLVPCNNWTGAPPDSVPLETSPGNSGLQYQGNGNWQFNWKTPKDYANQCRVARVTLADGSVHEFRVQFKK